MSEQIFYDLKELIEIHLLGASDRTVTLESMLRDFLNDSVAVVVFITEIEKKYQIELTHEKVLQLKKIKDLIVYIENSRKKILNNENGHRHLPVLFLRFFVFSILDFFLFIIFNSYFRLKKTGDFKAMRQEKNFILISNHSSHLDTLVLYALMSPAQRKETYVAVAKDYFYKNRIFKFIFSELLNTIAFDRNMEYQEGLKEANSLLIRGKNLIVYPEGTRSKDGKIGKFKEGIGFLVVNSSKPVLPVSIENTYSLWPKGKFFPLPGTVKVRLGIKESFLNEIKGHKESALLINLITKKIESHFNE